MGDYFTGRGHSENCFQRKPQSCRSCRCEFKHLTTFEFRWTNTATALSQSRLVLDISLFQSVFSEKLFFCFEGLIEHKTSLSFYSIFFRVTITYQYFLFSLLGSEHVLYQLEKEKVIYIYKYYKLVLY